VLSEKPWKLESVLALALGIFISMFFGGIAVAIVRHFLGSTSSSAQTATLVIAALSFQGAVLVLSYFFVRKHGATWDDAFGFRIEPKHALWVGCMVGMLFLPVGWVLQWASVQLLGQFEVKIVEQQAVQILKVAESWPNRFALGVVAIFLAPAAEEILFRGIFYPWLKRVWSRSAALIVTSVFFAIIHSNFTAIFTLKFSDFAATLGTFLPLTLLAMVFALLYEKTGNLLASITAHSVFNTANFIMLYIVQHFSAMP
jgi:uncharacterized protein